MNKMLVAVFNSEAEAFDGLSALKDLHERGELTLYATAVLAKDASGRVSTRQAADEGPMGTALGALVGSTMGLLGGPVGLAVGASIGGLTGMLVDLDESGIDIQFVDDVSKALTPGKAAVLADVEESWVTPVDTRIAKAGGIVFRRLRSEVIEDQFARETAAFKAEVTQLHEEFAQAKAEDKAAIQKRIDDAKITAMQGQLKQANERQKAKIEQRITEMKSDLERRTTKLNQAGRLAKEALTA